MLYKAFAPSGRRAKCDDTQGDALGYELLPLQGVWGKPKGCSRKERYPSVLHLNDKMLAIVGNTIDVKDAATEIIRFSKLFLILECYVLDLKLAFK